MLHNLVRLNLSQVRLDLSQNGVDHTHTIRLPKTPMPKIPPSNNSRSEECICDTQLLSFPSSESLHKKKQCPWIYHKLEPICISLFRPFFVSSLHLNPDPDPDPDPDLPFPLYYSTFHHKRGK